MAARFISAFQPLLTADLYKSLWTQFETFAGGYIKRGQMAEPIVGFMLLVGTTGYLMEYWALGRYHVAHKKEKIELALKEYDAKHTGGHH
mmetsp:Transcript_9169/g.29735  ORF Transcript_9169/g.29735 Transcript_9169/m.29735 type:complete len:90 (-) Transcript_9169:219-488(-)|eukprot:CAMPEP_0118919428 /NCGR_PEP_ID=MMETSP1166-20130328/18554_1 /TAXON_ID=1104430 /ORGANISM="Chrysoreinhardia sp, Strain CCMP3193" /LENGTH=89 /DNA_ID=CAMNT_0006859955 /DNA_START=33 /DNA_END=302 /DNA_ORIENTATION=+